MKKFLLFALFTISFAHAQEVLDNDDDYEDLTLDCPEFNADEEWAVGYPCDVDVDEVWFWENETMYPTKKEDSWVEDLSRPW